MLSSLSSKSDSNKRHLLLSISVWFCRIVTGATFIFSGFVKAVDPWGTIYKFEEYLAALNIPMLDTLLVICVFGLCAFEFIIGIALISGCYRRSAPILALAFMCVMLPVTFWVAVSDPVKDCGCFGDVLIISNWATFWKNVILTLLIIWLVKSNKRTFALITPALQWIGVVGSIAFILAVSLAGYMIQPLLDFRGYTIGTGFISPESDNDDEPDFQFIYEKDGKQKVFGVDDELPDEASGWKFIERKEIYPEKKKSSEDIPSHSFRFWNMNGDEDVTGTVTDADNTYLLLLVPDLEKVSPAATWKINELYDWSKKLSITMMAVVSGSENSINEWIDLSMPQYNIYTSDDTAIKEVARGNPAMIYVEDNNIIWKSTLDALDVESIVASENISEAKGILRYGTHELLNLVYLYLIWMAVPIALSLLPRVKSFIHDDKVRHE